MAGPVSPQQSAQKKRDPLAAAIVSQPGQQELAPPTPVRAAEPDLIPPAPPACLPEERRFRVRSSKIVNVGGSMTTLAAGSIVSARTHDLAALRTHGVELEPEQSN